MLDEQERLKDEEIKPEASSEIDARARRMGWVPEEEWDDNRASQEGRAKPKKFVTAEEFIARTESNIPIMRERLRHQDHEIVGLRKKIEDGNAKIDEMHRLFVDQRRMDREARERIREEARREAMAKQDEAVETGDTIGYKQAKQELERIDKEAAAEAAAPPLNKQEQEEPEPKRREVDPDTKAWLAENKWFTKDPVLNSVMIAHHTQVIRENPEMSVLEQLEEAARQVRERYPERFDDNPRRREPASVRTPTGGPIEPKGGKRWADIPKEDQDAYERQRKQFEARGYKYTKEEFIKDYFE